MYDIFKQATKDLKKERMSKQLKESQFISWLCGEPAKFPHFQEQEPINKKVRI